MGTSANASETKTRSIGKTKSTDRHNIPAAVLLINFPLFNKLALFQL
jgi:hypothetical protein